MASQMIGIPSSDNHNFQGYLSLPPAGKGPGIVLIQEIFGVNKHIKAVADQYALDGYVVLAPDLFWRIEPNINLGYEADDLKKGMAYQQKLDLSLAIQDLVASTEFLRSRDECTGEVASLGYCMGGLLSYLCAARAGVDAAVCYYPGGIDSHLEEAEKIACPILLHFAGNDSYISATTIKATQEQFSASKNAVIEVYPAVEHGFNCWDRSSYNQQASSLAHGLTLSFLAKAY